MSGEYICDLESRVWVSSIKYILDNFDIFEFDKEKTHMLWVVNGGHIRRHVKDDTLILEWLKKILPGYSGTGLNLYRGECNFLYKNKMIGFCWTPKREVAENFASGLNSIESGGVLLKSFVPKEAILSAPNDHSINWLNESEYTCDPTKLTNIEVIGHFKKYE